MKTFLIEIKPGFARRNKIPNIFVGVVPAKTEKAAYIYGHGSMVTRKTGMCCVCGRTLTHPVSVQLGIGPECGGHWWDWKLIGGYTEANIERLKEEMTIRMKDMVVDQWFPRSVIKSAVEETEELVTCPADHKMLKREPVNGSSQGATPRPKVPRRATMIQFQNEEYGIRIQFPFNRDDLEKVKSLQGRKYNSDAKEWTAPMPLTNIEQLQGWGFDMDPKLIKFLERKKVVVEDLKEADVPGLKMKLFPYQGRGVDFLEQRDGRALIADEMGLGKTAQALAYLQKNPKKRPVVIVVPASLKLNWAKEIKMWMSNTGIGQANEAQVLSGTTPYEIATDIAIINYDVLAYWVQELIDYNPDVLIVDEIHYAKNNSAKRTKALKKLAKVVPHFIGLSGTPIVNRPVEFLNAIKMVDPTVFPNSWEYLQRYCGAKNNGFGWDFSGATNTEELHKIVTKSIMLRRKKSEVLKDLPDKLRTFSPTELTNRSEYNKAESDFIQFVKEQKGAQAAEKASNAEALATIEGLKQLAVEGKMDQAIEWIRNFLDSDQKLVVFAVHKFVIDRLMKEFGDIAVKVDGSVTGPNRQVAVDRFQNEAKTRLFIGNIKAAGVGITLTAASNVAFLELPWTPGDVSQAEDRIHRIGQKDACTIHYLLAESTIEERIARLLDRKREILDSVLDGKDPEEGSLLMDLINEYDEK